MLKYSSGEDIHPGDRVEYSGVSAIVEFVVAGPGEGAGLDWYFQEHGAGAMLTDPVVFGRVYVSGDDVEDLVLVSRGPSGSK
jgi:hypothetical protein